MRCFRKNPLQIKEIKAMTILLILIILFMLFISTIVEKPINRIILIMEIKFLKQRTFSLKYNFIILKQRTFYFNPFRSTNSTTARRARLFNVSPGK